MIRKICNSGTQANTRTGTQTRCSLGRPYFSRGSQRTAEHKRMHYVESSFILNRTDFAGQQKILMFDSSFKQSVMESDRLI